MRQYIEKPNELHRGSRLNSFHLLFFVLCFTQQLSADSEDFDRWDSILHNEEFLHSVEPPDSYFDKKNWNVSIGMIGGSAPKYRGADENEFGYAPLVRIIWKDLIFLRSRKLGVYVYEDDKNRLGGFIRHKGGRNNEDEGLEGLDKIDSTGVVGAFYRYNFGYMKFKSEVSHDALGQDQGTIITSSLSTGLPRKKHLVSVSIGTTWASDEHMDTYYGIDARQSTNSGLRQFNASSGFREVSVGLGSRYIYSKHVSISGHIQYLRMLGDAADSPVVKDRGSADQYVVGLGLSYTF